MATFAADRASARWHCQAALYPVTEKRDGEHRSNAETLPDV
jgi:hypothetical protein